MQPSVVADLIAAIFWVVLFHWLASLRWSEPARRRFGSAAPFALFLGVMGSLFAVMLVYLSIADLVAGTFSGFALFRAVAAFIGSTLEYALWFLLAHVALRAWRRLRIQSS
jgi:hypothetical protein